MNHPDFPYLTIAEAASALGIGQRHVRRLIDEDKMPRTFLWGDVWHVHKEDVEEYRRRAGRQKWLGHRA